MSVELLREARNYLAGEYHASGHADCQGCDLHDRISAYLAQPEATAVIEYKPDGYLLAEVERLEDMSVGGSLKLLLQQDGDIIVAVKALGHDDLFHVESVEFCTSGGRSRNTLEALRGLMAAMQKDNKERPLQRAPAAAQPKSFSDFIRNATLEEKARVYSEVMEKASERMKPEEAAPVAQEPVAWLHEYVFDPSQGGRTRFEADVANDPKLCRPLYTTHVRSVPLYRAAPAPLQAEPDTTLGTVDPINSDWSAKGAAGSALQRVPHTAPFMAIWIDPETGIRYSKANTTGESLSVFATFILEFAQACWRKS